MRPHVDRSFFPDAGYLDIGTRLMGPPKESTCEDETIACRLTAPLQAALATIGMHGKKALPIAWSCIERSVDRGDHFDSQSSPVHFSRWPLLDGSVREDVVLCAIDDQTVEIHCHGGVAVSNAILESLRLRGCQVVDSSAWALRTGQTLLDQPSALDPAFSESEIRTAAQRALIETTSERAAGILLDQLNGALRTATEKLAIAVSDGDSLSAARQAIDLLRWSDLGLHLSRPWKVVLAGPPNVGKSSLINSLSGQQHAIVHSQPGTTRDWIEADTLIDGWPVRLYDTAGIRETDELVEQEGVRRAIERIAEADLVVLVVDSTLGWTEQHESIVSLNKMQIGRPRVLCAWNKSDLGARVQLPEHHAWSPIVDCSALIDIDPLLQAIATTIVPESPPPGSAVPFTQEQVTALQKIVGQRATPAE